MTSDHLLPPNATALERSLSLSTDLLTRLGGETEPLKGFKTDPSDSLLPWLIWEYGLGELLPYLPDPRRAIYEGIRWQRLRGTPAALTTALSWIGATATVEQETPGIHFAEFQFDPGQVLDDDGTIANLIAMARLSAPARSRLSRIYHGWDLRRLVLDESRLGEALLSDHSGVFWRDGQTKLSFGRSCQLATPPLDVGVVPVREAVRFAVARLMDRYLLSFSALGDPGHTPNEEILHSHLFTLANALGVPNPVGVRPERKFCKAMVVLSDSTPLGDINANLPRFVWAEQGEQFGLGKGTLSESDHRLRRAAVLARIYAAHPGDATVPDPSLDTSRTAVASHPVRARADTPLGLLRLGDERQVRDAWQLLRLYSLIPAPLPDPARFAPRLFQKAQVVLSEVRLGDVNSRTPRRAVFRIKPVPKLGDLALGDIAEIEWRALTEMQICTSVLTPPLPYDFEDAAARMLRLLTQATEPYVSAVLQPARISTASTRAAWQGQTWTGVRWPTSSWTDTRELISSAHSTQP